MVIEIIYRCWSCGEEKTEETGGFYPFSQPAEDPTRSEMIIWNLCPSCITKEKDDIANKAIANKITFRSTPIILSSDLIRLITKCSHSFSLQKFLALVLAYPN